MSGEHHSKAGVARLNLSRKEGRRWLISVEECVELTRIDIDL